METEEAPRRRQSQPVLDLEQGRLALGPRNRRLVLPLFPVLLLIYHLLVYPAVFFRLDLPVSDDANYFGYSRLFARYGAPLYADWTPVLTYWGAALDHLPYLSWYGLFFVYSFTCKLILLWGIYAFVAQFTQDKIWAFLGTLLASVCFTYWLMINGRAFPSGLMLLMLAGMKKRGSLDFFTALACVALSFLFRPEFVFPAAGWAAWFVWRRGRGGSWRGILTPGKAGVVFILIVSGLWLPVMFRGQLSTNRLLFAFAQKFRNYVVLNQFDKRVGLPPDADWYRVMDTFFPRKERDRESFLARWSPLYNVVSANSGVFGRFVWANTRPLLIGNFPFTYSKRLSRTLNLYVYLSFFAFLAMVIRRQGPPERSHFLAGSLIFIAGSAPPCLLIQPLRDYVYPAVIWFTVVIPYYWASRTPVRLPLAGALIAAVLGAQTGPWVYFLKENSSMINWKRAQLLQAAGKKVPLEGAAIAEAYPVFCSAFSSVVPRSVHYPVTWDDEGRLRSYGEQGIPVDYILFEENPPPHLRSTVARQKNWMQKWGEPVSAGDGYKFWKVLRRSVAQPGEIVITDHRMDDAPLAGEEDADSPGDRQLVIHWNFGDERSADYHVYVAVDGGDFQYLGRAGSSQARLFEWRAGRPELNPAFQQGPEFGRRYLFRVFALPPPGVEERPRTLTARSAIRYRETAAVIPAPPAADQ